MNAKKNTALEVAQAMKGKEALGLGAGQEIMVMKFRQRYGLPIRFGTEEKLKNCTAEEIALQLNLLWEEVLEYFAAFGFDSDYVAKAAESEGKSSSPAFAAFDVGARRESIDVCEVADASADIKYILYGSDWTFGFDSYEVFREVHASNMTKLDDDGHPIRNGYLATGKRMKHLQNPDQPLGKILKGPNYTKPNIRVTLGLTNGETK